LTKEQYAGVAKVPKLGLLSTSRDALNPLLNTETLKNRLFVIQHYKYLHGVEFAHWPHFVLANIGRHLMKYKFNYAVKGFAAFLLYRAVSEYRHYNSRAFLTMDQHGYFGANILASSALFGGICAII
jgi:hypothetical protein